MTTIDLITGFLGSGKTTFLRLYAENLINKGKNIGILENDYGAVNVDMMLLKDLRGDLCELEMVAGACDADCHRRRFKTKLISMAMCGYDRVIVEPSGIFDVDEFFDVLREEPLNRMYQIGSVITIVDSRLPDDMSLESDYYLASQIAQCNTIVLSRTQLTDSAQINSVKKHITKALEFARVSRKSLPVIWDKNWKDFSLQDFEALENSGYEAASFEKLITEDNNGFSSVYFLDIPMSTTLIKEHIGKLFGNPSYGNIFRIKGFYLEEGVWYEVNATSRETEIKRIAEGQQVIIVIGEKLNEPCIKSLLS